MGLCHAEKDGIMLCTERQWDYVVQRKTVGLCRVEKDSGIILCREGQCDYVL